MWPFSQPREDESLRKRVNQLETDLETLRLDRAAMMVNVLSACEKVLHQLGARERKRDRENDAPESPRPNDPDNGNVPVTAFPRSRRQF